MKKLLTNLQLKRGSIALYQLSWERYVAVIAIVWMAHPAGYLEYQAVNSGKSISGLKFVFWESPSAYNYYWLSAGWSVRTVVVGLVHPKMSPSEVGLRSFALAIMLHMSRDFIQVAKSIFIHVVAWHGSVVSVHARACHVSNHNFAQKWLIKYLYKLIEATGWLIPPPFLLALLRNGIWYPNRIITCPGRGLVTVGNRYLLYFPTLSGLESRPPAST